MSTRNFGEAVKSFVDAGIKAKWFLPIAPQGAQIGKNTFLEQKSLGKAPGRFDDRTNTWRGLGGGYVVKGIEKADFQEMKSWPTPNAGILGRAYPGIDSDAMSDAAADLVEYAMTKSFGKDANCAVRIRGTGPRRLYAFKCADPNNEATVVRTRHISYKLAGDDTVHGLDIIGFGNQYVITGIHPSGDKYEWMPDASLQDISTVDALTEIDNDDAERFLSVLAEEITAQGGEVIKSSGGRHGNEEIDTTGLKPVMSIDDALKGLDQIPNTPENFPFRDDLVSVLSSVRAALGRDADTAEPDLRDWATAQGWADEDYFDKIWESIDRVRVGRDSLDRFFRRNGIQTHVGAVFDNNAPRLNSEIKQRKEDKKAKREGVLAEFADNYIVGNISLRDANSQNVLRHVWDPYHDFPAWNWFRGELGESDWNILSPIHEDERYPRTRVGYANFMRDLKREYPEIFYSGETRDPRYGFGEIVEEPDDSGNTTRRVNMRHPSRAMMIARRKDENVHRSQKDVETILTLGRGLFGKLFDYELDTQAYMVQRGDRPGSMLFMVGDSGVGKSLWMQLQGRLFDGNARGENSIDGTKLLNESSRRFVLARAQGFRILSIKELPESDRRSNVYANMAAITSQLKQIVDPGPDGDWMQVEQKGKDIVTVRNFARVLVSSNYANSLAIEEQDRRIFYVEAGIKRDNKPDPEFYEEFVAILDDPERLAAWWRYLDGRDIGDYDRNTAPPSSAAKDERIVMEMRNAGQRHLTAAMAWFKAEGRKIARVDEIADVMSEMSEAEHINTNGEIDDRTKYHVKTKDGKPDMLFASAIRQMRKADGIKLNHPGLRTSKARDPGVYIVGNRPDVYESFLSADRSRLRDMVEDDIDKGINGPHPWPIFQLPEE